MEEIFVRERERERERERLSERESESVRERNRETTKLCKTVSRMREITRTDVGDRRIRRSTIGSRNRRKNRPTSRTTRSDMVEISRWCGRRETKNRARCHQVRRQTRDHRTSVPVRLDLPIERPCRRERGGVAEGRTGSDIRDRVDSREV